MIDPEIILVRYMNAHDCGASQKKICISKEKTIKQHPTSDVFRPGREVHLTLRSPIAALRISAKTSW